MASGSFPINTGDASVGTSGSFPINTGDTSVGTSGFLDSIKRASHFLISCFAIAICAWLLLILIHKTPPIHNASSGVQALFTTGSSLTSSNGDGWITLTLTGSGVNPATNQVSGSWMRGALVNGGGADMLFSLDGGITSCRLSAGTSWGPSTGFAPFNLQNVTIQVERITGGTDITGVYAWGFQ